MQTKLQKHYAKITKTLSVFLVLATLASCDNDDSDGLAFNEDFHPTSTTGQVVHREGFSFSYNEAHEQSEWVSYYLDTADLPDVVRERPYFYADPKVVTGSAVHSDYTNSGYSRGHLCPAADRKGTEALYDETFFMSNISPQLQVFNAGVWLRLEYQVRDWAVEKGGVYIATGGVLKDDLPTIGNSNTVSVPEYFYKVLLSKDQTQMIGFLIPHESSDAELETFAYSVDYIESVTGIDFFTNLETDTQDTLEQNLSVSEWGF